MQTSRGSHGEEKAIHRWSFHNCTVYAKQHLIGPPENRPVMARREIKRILPPNDDPEQARNERDFSVKIHNVARIRCFDEFGLSGLLRVLRFPLVADQPQW